MNSSSREISKEGLWVFGHRPGPLIATAIHDGHDLRPEVAELMKLPEADRLREEDPYTGSWVDIAPANIVARRSRFEVDLNRPREKAVYVHPEDCWGLDVWSKPLSEDIIKDSLLEYDEYYSFLNQLLTQAEAEHGKFVLLDIHSYNHRRNGPDAAAESATENPEINIGTGTMDRERWAPLVDRFMHDLRSFDFMGRRLDVRENVKFEGGNQVRWVHEKFPLSGCGLAIEFKKFWMDEWTGEKDGKQVGEIGAALRSTIPGLLDELKKL
ncbi:N-formylglutamate amidohydrolase [soil metagenome]